MNEFILPVDHVIETNRAVLREQNREDQHRVLDHGRLESALARPMQTFGGALLIPSFLERAAALLQGLVAAHAFQDGNKRTAWISCAVFLAATGTPLRSMNPNTAADFVESVATHHYELSGIAQWLDDFLED